MMLWVAILTFFGALVAVLGGNLPAVLKANALVRTVSLVLVPTIGIVP